MLAWEATLYKRDDSVKRGFSKLTVIRPKADNMPDALDGLVRILDRAEEVTPLDEIVYLTVKQITVEDTG